MQNAKLKMQKERCEACSLSSILHFTFLILHSLASSAFNLPLPPIANRYKSRDTEGAEIVQRKTVLCASGVRRHLWWCVA